MPTGNPPAVLYVDDEPINLRVFEANFRNRFRVICCSSGPEALAVLAHRGHEVGVLLSDQRMPEMTGVQLLEMAREMYPDMQRMLLTAYSDMQAVMDAVNRGQVSRYFVKPWIKEELLSAIEDALRIFTLQVRLREIEARLLRSERLATIGQVSAGIAHELMNPVSYMTQNVGTLRGELKMLAEYVSTALKKTPNDEVKRTLEDLPQLLEDVEAGAKHIRQVALGIRGQVKGEETENTSSLADVAQFASKLARGEVQQRGRLVVNGPEVKVVGGPVKLCQILLNLIVNAAHALDNTGRAGLIEVSWKDEGEKVRLTVKDNGSGIPENIRARVFEPMFTTKAQGTGLGLAISRDALRELGGDITLTSTEGAGTTIELQLPKAPAEQ
jgi:C4-dicarboxylate-specific signal transduction histidine kinase